MGELVDPQWRTNVNRMARVTVYFFCLAFIFYFENAQSANSIPPINATIKNLNANPENFVNAGKLRISGKLTLRGDYWGDYRLILFDSEGNEIAVTPWAPHEIAPSPFEEINKKMPKTMDYYIDRNMSVIGNLRSVTDKNSKNLRPVPANLKSGFYFEVIEASEISD